MKWTLVVAGPAERSLCRLQERVAAAVVEFMVGPLLDEPRRVGKPLRRELTGVPLSPAGRVPDHLQNQR